MDYIEKLHKSIDELSDNTKHISQIASITAMLKELTDSQKNLSNDSEKIITKHLELLYSTEKYLESSNDAIDKVTTTITDTMEAFLDTNKRYHEDTITVLKEELSVQKALTDNIKADITTYVEKSDAQIHSLKRLLIISIMVSSVSLLIGIAFIFLGV